jgi:hypothetical protein
MNDRHKRRLLGFGVILLSSLFSFLLLELLVRSTLSDKVVLFPRYHSKAIYGPYTLRRTMPGIVFHHRSADGQWRFQVNGQGFRSTHDFRYEKEPGNLRVLVLGDSHTMGYEVRQEYTFSSVLERYLKRSGRKVEVINTGVSGFGTAEQLAFLREEGFRYDPDFVVLAFYANDYEDNVKSSLFTLNEQQELIAKKFVHAPGVEIQRAIYSIPGSKWLGEHSYAYSLLFNGTWVFFKKMLQRQSKKDVLEYAVSTADTHNQYLIDLASKLIEEMSRSCRNNDSRFIVAEIPKSNHPNGFVASFDDRTKETAQRFSDSCILANDYLGRFQDLAEFHLPRGSNHISEFTHVQLGLHIGRTIEELLPTEERVSEQRFSPGAFPASPGEPFSDMPSKEIRIDPKPSNDMHFLSMVPY